MAAATGGGDTRLRLMAPLSGVLVPLDDVPDPVFSQRLVGDGVSVDPVSALLLAPCDGRITQLHSAAHALTIATAAGVEVMMHIGLDTVGLKGRGFTARVKAGDDVRTGDALIEFDADFVATNARSLLTQVIITSADKVAGLRARGGVVRAGIDIILEADVPGHAPTPSAAPAGRRVESDLILVSNATGLHARPAAVLSARARPFKSDIRLLRDGQEANAKSVVAIMALEVTGGQSVRIVAEGPDAAEAVAALTTALVREAVDPPPASRGAPATAAQPAAAQRSTDPNVLVGVPASPGVSIGRIVQLRHQEPAVPERGGHPPAERRALDAAIAEARTQLQGLQARMGGGAQSGNAGIFGAHEELLEDPELLGAADQAIRDGASAAWAWRTAYTAHAGRLSGLSNALLAGRANDVRDVGRRVLRVLTGTVDAPISLPNDAILVAEELTPSEAASLNRGRVRGFCTTLGGSSSHVSILARALELPAVVAIDPRALDIADGTEALLDGDRGIVQLAPSTQAKAQVKASAERLHKQRSAELAASAEPAITLDGRRVEIAANVSGLEEATRVPDVGGEAVGLFRSEFLFLDRTEAPDEHEQAGQYEAIARALGPDRLLVIRTLDIGGDKPLAYLALPAEQNPFLGVRGIRVQLARPEMLRIQLRAILRASRVGKVAVMFPMISTFAEWRAARALLAEEQEKMGVPEIQAGIMVETPAAAVLADLFAREADFLSIGTNDLSQYTLAMDRTHPALAPHVDALDPSVLRLIDQTVKGAHAHGKWVGVCGGAAGDPQAVPILVGLGIDELSVSVPAVPAVKAQVRQLSLEKCRALAERALAATDAKSVRGMVVNSAG